MTRTCIIVSPYFPPSTLAGVHRARHLAKHLPAAGWTPIVVCVDEAYHEEKLDPGLAGLVPASVEIVKVSAVSSRLCRPLGLGEISLRAWRPLRQALFRLLETRSVGAVLITGSPFYPMLMASEIKRQFGVPVVLDFQDPWVSAWGATRSKWSKTGVSHQLSKRLEPRAVRYADFITSVSETQNGEMAARYPWLDKTRMAAIPIGGDPEDYEALRSTPRVQGGFALEEGTFNISYVGTIWPAVVDTLRAVLRAAARVREQEPQLYARLRLNFVGTTANPNARDGLWVRDLAESEGVSDVVRELPQRLPYLEALSLQAHSQVILMLGSLEPHYTASKIYGVLMAGRPYLSVFHEASTSHEVLSRAGGGLTLAIPAISGLLGMDQKIKSAIVALALGGDGVGQVDPAAYAQYEAKAIAARYAQIFDSLGQ